MKTFKFFLDSIKIHSGMVNFLITILTLFAAVWFGYAGIAQQEKIYKITKAEQEYPFFQYSYDRNAKVFKVNSYDYVRINSVHWSFPEYENGRMNGRISLITINSLTKDLGWSEIRDHFAGVLSDKLATKRRFNLVQEDTECLFFAYAQMGIPVVVKVSYDLRDRRGLISRDIVLLQRLDTNFADIHFEAKVESDEELANLLKRYEVNLKNAFEPVVEMVSRLGADRSNKIYDGTCNIQFKRPEG